MKVVIVSGYMNKHMWPLSQCFLKHPLVSKFYFVETERITEYRLNMGFSNMSEGHEWIISADNDESKVKKIVEEADVAIIAHAPTKYIEWRMDKNKLTFRCTERFYKKGIWRRWVPSSYLKKWKDFLRYKDRKLYYLTVGAYMPYDLNLVGFPLNKCFQWAYFPQTEALDAISKQEKDYIRVFWAASMTKVKHPEMAVKIAAKMKKNGVAFKLYMAGDGPVVEQVKRKIKKYQVENEVVLLGNCVPKDVQLMMKKSDVFLFTSDYREGWGAVLNECMAQECVPVASKRAGAAPVLIQNGDNGYTFSSITEAANEIEILLADKKKRKKMANQAKETINTLWSAQYAADRFIEVAQDILSDNQATHQYESGPMAPVILRKAKNYIYGAF